MINSLRLGICCGIWQPFDRCFQLSVLVKGAMLWTVFRKYYSPFLLAISTTPNSAHCVCVQRSGIIFADQVTLTNLNNAMNQNRYCTLYTVNAGWHIYIRRTISYFWILSSCQLFVNYHERIISPSLLHRRLELSNWQPKGKAYFHLVLVGEP